MKKNIELNEFSLLISEKLKKKIRISVISTHIALLLFLIVWYFVSNMQTKKEVIMKVKLFQLPPAPTVSASKQTSKKSAAPKKKKSTKKKTVKKKTIKPTPKKKPKKKRTVKKKPKPRKKTIKKKITKKTTKKKVIKKVSKPKKSSTKKSVKPKKRYLKAEDIKISKNILRNEPKRVVKKIEIPSVSEKELSNTLAQSFSTLRKNSKISTRRSANTGNISQSYFNSVSSIIYKQWNQPSKSETGRSNPTVEVQVTVNSYGKITKASIIRKSSNRAMNASVVDLLKRLKNLPTPPNGNATFSIILEVQN